MRAPGTRIAWSAVWVVALAVLALDLAQAAAPRLGAIADQVLRQGLDGRLPPNLSLVLGIASGSSVDVKQAVMREVSEVRVFNVCVARPDEIVLLRTDERRKTTAAYLVSRSGELRKAVRFRAGGQPRILSRAEAQAGFAAEIRFWTRRGR